MTTTLTERYIAATVKTLPPAAQDDVRNELAASIDDAIEARLEQGESSADAERAVLTELGDPGILAAGYADRPLHLIGPRYYLTWWRLLKLLLIIVPVVAVAGSALAQLLAEATIGEVIGSSIGVGVSVAIHIAFWVTVVFVILERSGADTGVRWNVDQLPEPQSDNIGRADMIAMLSLLVIAAGVLVWDHFRGFVPSDAGVVPILNPELWPWAMAGMFVLMGLEGAMAIMIYASRRWTTTFAIINTALAVLFASLWLTLLGRNELINPAFVEVAFTPDADRDALHVLGILTVFFVIGIAVWDIIDGWRKTARAHRAIGR